MQNIRGSELPEFEWRDCSTLTSYRVMHLCFPKACDITFRANTFRVSSMRGVGEHFSMHVNAHLRDGAHNPLLHKLSR